MAPMDWPHRATHSHGSTATEAFTRRATHRHPHGISPRSAAYRSSLELPVIRLA